MQTNKQRENCLRNARSGCPSRTTWPPPWLVTSAGIRTPPAEPAPADACAVHTGWPPGLKIISQAEAAKLYPTGSVAPVVPADYPPILPADDEVKRRSGLTD
jgi:hypothetical protein